LQTEIQSRPMGGKDRDTRPQERKFISRLARSIFARLSSRANVRAAGDWRLPGGSRVAMAATLHNRGAVLFRHGSLLPRPRQHLGCDNSAGRRRRLRFGRTGPHSLGVLLELSMAATGRRMVRRPIRRQAGARVRRRGLVDRDVHHTGRRAHVFYSALRRANPARSW